MAKHGTLGEFDQSTGDWKSYIERAQQYFVANDVDDADKKRAILLSCVGDKAYRTIKDVLSPDSPSDVALATLIDKMTKHLQPEPSEIVQRFRFHTRVRQSLKILLSLEAAEKGLKDIAGDAHKKIQYFQPRRSQRNPPDKQVDRKTQDCKHCGGTHEPSRCRFRFAECNYCHKRGHIATVCRRKLKRQSGSQAFKRKATNSLDEKETQPSEYSNRMLNVRSPDSKRPYEVDITVQDRPVRMEVDTGATVSVMTHDAYLATWRGTSSTD